MKKLFKPVVGIFEGLAMLLVLFVLCAQFKGTKKTRRIRIIPTMLIVGAIVWLIWNIMR